MPIYKSTELVFGHPEVTRAAYNALDCAVTAEVYTKLLEEFKDDPHNRMQVYQFMKDLQAPALDMTFRGIRVDMVWRNKVRAEIEADIAKYQAQLDVLAEAVWGKGLNPRSPKQLKDFFYGALGLKEIRVPAGRGQWKVTVNDEALDRLELFPRAAPFTQHIRLIRRLGKDLSVVKTSIDSDGRFRAGYRVAGTETGRWSSAKNAFRTGSNAQNITDKMRRMFISDPGMKLCYSDLEQAESRIVGILAGVLFDEWSYYEACLSGDLHTMVCKMVWTDLGWTGDPKEDREIADQHASGRHSYRDLAKRLGHGCLTEDHEVLTPDGWVPIAEKPDVIMCWDPRGAEFRRVTRWTDFNYSGTLHELEGRSLSACMTDDHRIPVFKDRNGPVHEIRMYEGLKKSWAIPLGHRLAKAGTKRMFGRLAAAIMSDGEITGNKTRFNFRKQRKKDRLIQLCKQYGVGWTEFADGRISIEYKIQKKAGPWLFEYAVEDLVDLVDEYKFWDGHQAKTSVSLFSKDREHLEWLQTIARLVGVGGNIQKPHKTGFGSISYTLQQNNRKFAAVSALKHTKREVENVRVLCPTVPTGWFFIRREGKISVTGNSNYQGSPRTMAKHTSIPEALAREFQKRYFAAFPGIRMYGEWVKEQLKTKGYLTTPLGRTRYFFDRPDAPETIRKAVAFVPQSSIGDLLNRALLAVWKAAPDLGVELLAQVHDAILFQYPASREHGVIPKVLDLMQVPFTYGGKEFTIPVEAAVGYNWAHKDKDNPNGVSAYVAD